MTHDTTLEDFVVQELLKGNDHLHPPMPYSARLERRRSALVAKLRREFGPSDDRSIRLAKAPHEALEAFLIQAQIRRAQTMYGEARSLLANPSYTSDDSLAWLLDEMAHLLLVGPQVPEVRALEPLLPVVRDLALEKLGARYEVALGRCERTGAILYAPSLHGRWSDHELPAYHRVPLDEDLSIHLDMEFLPSWVRIILDAPRGPDAVVVHEDMGLGGPGIVQVPGALWNPPPETPLPPHDDKTREKPELDPDLRYVLLYVGEAPIMGTLNVRPVRLTSQPEQAHVRFDLSQGTRGEVHVTPQVFDIVW